MPGMRESEGGKGMIFFSPKIPTGAWRKGKAAACARVI